ncbi:S-layer homology domain-containing protein [Paenibacillus doosanensis]|uniref:S-layer homology domain-containing protein n=1 Tax=Paenibacillus doosanensis TaxID=1229154 RepID=UPI0021801A0A|nr:S-layer homology domain-containing protein [Paenibacillus doosanensis]MCS7461462.1 S-layer homology domain-containing protein [Paenibacillus doosanensis]
MSLRRQRNKFKLMFAAASIVILKRTAYVLALVSLPFSLFAPGHSTAVAAEDAPFHDLEGHWAEEPVKEAVAEGIVSGYADGTFRPDQTVSRGEFVVMLSHGLHIPPSADAEDGSERDAYLKSLLDVGIVGGGDFSADALDQELQRSEMIRLALRSLDPEGAADDADKQWEQAVSAGLLDGEQDARSLSQQTATRAEAVVVLQRLQHAFHLKEQ